MSPERSVTYVSGRSKNFVLAECAERLRVTISRRSVTLPSGSSGIGRDSGSRRPQSPNNCGKKVAPIQMVWARPIPMPGIQWWREHGRHESGQHVPLESGIGNVGQCRSRAHTRGDDTLRVVEHDVSQPVHALHRAPCRDGWGLRGGPHAQPRSRATITGERFPLLFQTGETAYRKAIVDGQHPHSFIMSLGFCYACRLSENTTLSGYFAPVCAPAPGPVAFPHKKVQPEASGFYRSGPGENRCIVQTGPINCWAARNRVAQVSVGRIVHPEALEPGDQVRATASLQYIKPRPSGSRASTLVWGRSHSTATHRNLNSSLVESVLPGARKNFIKGRAELAHKVRRNGRRRKLHPLLSPGHYQAVLRQPSGRRQYIHAIPA